MQNLSSSQNTLSSSQTLEKDGIAHLLRDHESFRTLFSRFRASTNNVEKMHIVDQIVLEVSQHASAEERYVYPLIMSRIDQGMQHKKNKGK